MSKEHVLTFYGNRADEYETAIFDLEWSKDDPRLNNFCNSPYSVSIHYIIKENGEKVYIKVEIDGKEAIFND